MDALILAGGLGTRLAHVVSDRAKPVASVAGRPFLHILLAQLEAVRAVRRAILCVGHLADTVQSAVGTKFGRLAIDYSHETRPMGTGGALAVAIRTFGLHAPVLALNGDSHCAMRIERLVALHRASRAKASLAAARVPDAARYGAARLEGHRVVAFAEKGAGGPAWINAGIYVLSARAVGDLARRHDAFSFEREALVPWCAEGAVAALRTRARFIDIGTREDFARANAFFARIGR